MFDIVYLISIFVCLFGVAFVLDKIAEYKEKKSKETKGGCHGCHGCDGACKCKHDDKENK